MRVPQLSNPIYTIQYLNETSGHTPRVHAAVAWTNFCNSKKYRNIWAKIYLTATQWKLSAINTSKERSTENTDQRTKTINSCWIKRKAIFREQDSSMAMIGTLIERVFATYNVKYTNGIIVNDYTRALVSKNSLSAHFYLIILTLHTLQFVHK